MSKRARLTESEAAKAGLKAWETSEGRRWLLKALNPNDVSLVNCGIPTLHSRNISVLNWQGDYTVNVPANIDAETPAYDTTLFLYQHPLIFGSSASIPNGCIDISKCPLNYHITRTANAGGGYDYVLNISGTPSSPVTVSRCTQFFNNQVNPSVFNGDSCLAGRRELFKQLTQKSRIVYGGATLIPSCSSEYDSGTLAVCQQVFSPRETILPTNNNIRLNTFLDNDFPSTSDLVQNPQMYYGRFRDGAYIPYKLNDPSATRYVNSEQEVTTRSPYFVYGVSFLGTIAQDGATYTGKLTEVAATYSAVDSTFAYAAKLAMYNLFAIRLYIQSYTGQRGFVDLSLASSTAGNSEVFFTSDVFATKALSTTLGPDAIVEGNAAFPVANASVHELNDLYMKVPEYITMFDWQASDNELANPHGVIFKSLDISSNVNADVALKRGTISPYNGQSLITVHMTGVSNTAPVKMILRYGSEILLVASSVYSPFKFMSPKYDESAIKSYARCIRGMKDAYFANAGSAIGQADYNNKLMILIENDAVDDLNRAFNQGGSWTGAVGNY